VLLLLLPQVMFYKADVPLRAVAEGFAKPSVPRANIGQAVALVGSLIMPHNIYLHSALVQTRQLRRQDDQHRQEALVYYGIESGLSLLVSGAVGAGEGLWPIWGGKGGGGGGVCVLMLLYLRGACVL
jgi:Mn2+/Fe2+ NRAMP family transporter